ncbi:MAG TPA: hypothetical protein PK765_04510 [bacterium]|nr:hypothetical protein [bacterium]
MTFLRAYAKNPARYDVSDAERLEVENRMVSMQRVFVDAWDEWVSPYITQDYQETGSADVSFTSSLVDVSIAYDSYTSILSFLRGEQSVDLDFDYTLDFKENELLPEELRGKSVSAQGDLTVKSFSEEGGVYVTVRELSIDLGAGFTSTEQDSVRLFEESLRGKTIRLPINTVNGSMPSMFDAVRALDAAIHSLSDVSVLMPVIKNAKGNYLLAVNPEAVNDVSEVIIREMPYISSEDLNSENSSRLTMLPGVVWREVDGKGELYRPFSSAIDGSDGYARLGYDDANESLVFAMRLKEEGHAGNNTLSIDMDRDRYNIQASIAEGFDMTLDWTDAEFDLRASGSDYAGEEWTFSIEGIANLRSHIDLVARYNDERLFSTSYQLIDNRSTYSFDLESEIPAYAFGNLESIPFSFQVSGYYDSSFGTFPIIKPEVYTSVEEWLEQLDSAGGNDGEELLDGLLQ